MAGLPKALLLLLSLPLSVVPLNIHQRDISQTEETDVEELTEDVLKNSAQEVVEELVHMFDNPRLNEDEDFLSATMIRFIEEPLVTKVKSLDNEIKKIRVPKTLLKLLRSDMSMENKRKTLENVILRLKQDEGSSHATLEIVKNDAYEDIHSSPSSDDTVKILPRTERAEKLPSLKFEPSFKPFVFHGPQESQGLGNPPQVFLPSPVPFPVPGHNVPHQQFAVPGHNIPLQPLQPLPPHFPINNRLPIPNAVPHPFQRPTPFNFGAKQSSSIKKPGQKKDNGKEEQQEKSLQDKIKEARKKVFKIKEEREEKSSEGKGYLPVDKQNLVHSQEFDIVSRKELLSSSIEESPRNQKVPQLKVGLEGDNLGFPSTYGEAGRDFPLFVQQDMPETSFSCEGKVYGTFYADVEAGCQVFHMCMGEAEQSDKFSFICPQGTLFNQANLVCTEWYKVTCSAEVVDLQAQLNIALSKERQFITSGQQVTDPLEDYPWRNRNMEDYKGYP